MDTPGPIEYPPELIEIMRLTALHGADQVFKMQSSDGKGELVGIPGKRLHLKIGGKSYILIRLITERTINILQQRFDGRVPAGYVTETITDLTNGGNIVSLLEGDLSTHDTNPKRLRLWEAPKDYIGYIYPLLLGEMKEVLKTVETI